MNSSFFRFASLFLCCALFAAAAPAALADEDVGSVIAARKTAWAERNEQQNLLASKSPVYTGDTLTTNPSGRLQVLFRDDSVLMMAPDTSAKVTEYLYGTDREASFNLNLTRGLTRMISGGIVEAKPGAMRVETSEVSVGIHGTEFAVLKKDGVTEVSQLSDKGDIVMFNKQDGKKYRLNTALTTMVFAAGQPGPPLIKKLDSATLRTLASLSRTDINTGSGSDQANGTNAMLLSTPKQLVVDQWSGAAIAQPIQQLVGIDPSGVYAGTYSGTHYGAFDMTISSLVGSPQVTAFTMIGDLGLDLDTPRPVGKGGLFDMSFMAPEYAATPGTDVLNVRGAATGSTVDMKITGTLVGNQVNAVGSGTAQ